MEAISRAVSDTGMHALWFGQGLALTHFRSCLSFNGLYRAGHFIVLLMAGLQAELQRSEEGKSLLGKEAISEKCRGEGEAESTGPVKTLPCSWWEDCPEPQTTFCSSFVILQTRVIHRPHVCGFGNQKLKICYGFSSSQNDPSPKLTD